jgi:hypothetical protein
MSRYWIGLLLLSQAAFPQQPSVDEIISKSVAANQRDFQAATNYNWKERDRTPKSSKTYQVTMIEGTPYFRLIALNGRPLSPDQERQEIQKQQQETQKRTSESPDERQKRIANFERDRRRDNTMMEQLTKGFAFTLVGSKTVRGFEVWVLKATPRPGYQPPNRDSEVLTGMEGELWIDKASYNWVRVHAIVLHPVSIEGFLAQVEPGTQFDLQKAPVGDGIWQPIEYSMRAQARVLFMFNHNSQEVDTYWDYESAAK